MFDIHNHVLFGLDDGAEDASASLALLHNAIAQGVTHLVATPHFNTSQYSVSIAQIEQAGSQLQQLIQQHQLPIHLALAAEVRLCDELITQVKQQRLPFIGIWQDQPALLLELPYRHYPVGTEKLTAWLIKQGVYPILAHPERFSYFLTEPQKLALLLKQGCGIQLTADALLGKRGQGIQALAQGLLNQSDNQVFLASDAHHAQSRPFMNDDLVQWLKQSGYANAQIETWLWKNPSNLCSALFAQPNQCFTGR